MNKLFSLNIFKKSFFIIFAAALVVSGFFVFGNVAQAEIGFQTLGAGTAATTVSEAYSGNESVQLHVVDGTVDIAAVTIPVDVPLNTITSLSFWQKLQTGSALYGANVILGVDTDNDGMYSSDDLAWHIGSTQHVSSTLGGDSFVEMDGVSVADTWGQVNTMLVGQWWTVNVAGDGFGGTGGGCYATLANVVNGVGACGSDIRIHPTDHVKVIKLLIGGSSSWNNLTPFVDSLELNGNVILSAPVTNGMSGFNTIQTAINAATDGDTINIVAGTYSPTDLDWDGYGFLRINKPLTLKGAGSSNTIIDGEHKYSIIPGEGEILAHSTCLWVGNSNINLEGLTVKGCDWGVRASDAHSGATEISDLTFNDVTVTDNYGHGVVFENYYGVSFSNIEFTNCNANANGDRGIYISPTSNAEDFTLTNTNANNNKKAGFNCQGTLNRLTINGGSFNDNTGGLNYEGNGPYFGAGIELDGCTNVEINNVEANRNGLLGPEDCGDVAWNTPPFSMVGGAGILLKDDTSNVKILNSELKDNANGILVEWCKHWPTGSQPTDIEGNYNKIEGNTYLGVSNRAPDLNLDATKNWWGASINPADVFPAIFEDDFNDYVLGNLNDQGSWVQSGVQSGGLVNVEDSVVFEGAKAVQSVGGETGFIYEKTGSLVNNGRIVVHVKSGDNDTDFQLHLREGGISRIIFGLNMTATRSVDYMLPPGEDWQNIGTFEADTWFPLEMEWRSSDHEVRYRFNEGTWTDWVLPFSAWTSGLDSMLFTGDANCATYWDYILEYPLSGNVNFDPWYADAAMTKLAMQTTENPDGTQSATIVTGMATTTQTSVGPVSVDIPAGIIITGPAGWDGTLVLPQVTAIFAQPTAPPGNTALDTSAIEIGLSDTLLTFNQAVKIVFAGQAGKYVGYSRGGVFTQITATCDSPTTSTLDVGADCKIDDGTDLIVWTKHFTQFITYNIYLNSPGSGSSFPPAAPSPLGDTNGDKKVDKYDFSLMMANWGKIGSNICDLNNDSKVDKYDFALLMLNWSM